MNVLVLHSFSVMELWLRALGKGEFACQGIVPWLHIPVLHLEGAQGDLSAWGGGLQWRLTIKGLIRNGFQHGQSRAVIVRLALSDGNSFMWAVKFVVLH